MAADPSSKLKPDDQPQLIVHQALHGYSGGHRLLESSCSLSAAAERQIDVLSDLSGSAPPSGFEEYLTVYPVVAAQMVAFAKTWLAREMSRPGCVWTHTLLLDFAVVRDLPRLGFLTQHFVRPDKKQGFASFADAIKLPIEDLSRAASFEQSRHPAIALALVQSWYSEDGRRPLVIPAESSRTFEDTLVSLWEQQVPAFRTSVSISTGSIADRKVGGTSFDIQVVPRQNTREVLRQCRGVNLEDAVHQPLGNATNWSAAGGEVLAGDLNFPSPALRSYLRSAADSEIRLVDIPLFAEAFSVWSGPTNPTEKVDRLWNFVATASPEKTQAAKLKMLFFGNGTGILNGAAESYMLQQLLLANRPTDFLDIAALQIPARCTTLAGSDVAAAVSLLEGVSRSRRPPETLIEAFNSLADALPSHALLQFLGRNRPLLYNVVSRRPELVREPDFWDTFASSHHEVIAAVARAPQFTSALAESIVEILIRPEGPHLIDVFIERCSDSNLATLLIVALSSTEAPAGLFERFLQRRMDAVLAAAANQRNLPRAFMIAASRVVLPGWSGNSQFPFGAWTAALRDIDTLRREEKIRVGAFSVAMALAWKVPESIEFLRSCFSSAYLEAKADRLDYQSWALLEPHVPSLWGWSNWDKCERLRRAILERIMQGVWPPAVLLQIAGDTETILAFIKTAADRGYQRIFPALLQSIDAASLMWSDQERLAVRRELVGHSKPDHKTQDFNRDFID